MEASTLFAALTSHIQPGLTHLSRLAFLLFAPQHSIGRQLRQIFSDPFASANKHHPWNWFDETLLIPYFAVMIILAIYGAHRYTLVYLYYKYKKNYNPNPPQHFADLPRFTIQLPMYNEQFVIDRLIEAVCSME